MHSDSASKSSWGVTPQCCCELVLEPSPLCRWHFPELIQPMSEAMSSNFYSYLGQLCSFSFLAVSWFHTEAYCFHEFCSANRVLACRIFATACSSLC